MGKANISFPEGLLEEVDRRAAEAGISRSGFIQEATARYIEQLDERQLRDARAARVERAKRHMRELGATLPPGPDGVALLRKMRDATPEWLGSPGGSDE
jgi:metal-responsive CopG/Arc/MetJ family transcriptional regulator